MHPCASITLDHARLSVMYNQGITWVLTTDLGLPDNSLADHLRATTQVANLCFFLLPSFLLRTSACKPPSEFGSEQVARRLQRFWSVAKGSRPCLLSSCDYRRDGYKAAITAAASLTAPFAMAQLSADFRYVYLSISEAASYTVSCNQCFICTWAFRSCCRPMAYFDGANRTASVTMLTASQLMDVVQRQEHSIGCCVVSASVGDIRCAFIRMMVETFHFQN
jgi:hypothetical protein